MDTQKDKMTEMDIRKALAESGQCTIRGMMRYMKNIHEGKYDKKLARKNAKEMVSRIPNY